MLAGSRGVGAQQVVLPEATRSQLQFGPMRPKKNAQTSRAGFELTPILRSSIDLPISGFVSQDVEIVRLAARHPRGARAAAPQISRKKGCT